MSFTFYFFVQEKNNLSLSNIISDFKIILKYTIPIHLSNLIGILGRSFERNILLITASSTQFAFYSVAMFKIPYIDIIKSSIGHVMIDQLSSNKIKNSDKILLWNYASIKLASIVYPSIIFFFVNAEIIIKILFTEKYEAASNLYRILILSFLFSPLFTGQVLQAYNQKKQLFRSELFTLLLSIILCPVLIYKFDIMGACIAFTIITLFNSLIQFYYLKLSTQLKLNISLFYELFKLVLIYLLAALFISFSLNYFDISSFVSLVLQSIFFLLIFFKKSLKLFL